MEKFILPVPKGVRYISDWKKFKLNDYPHIIDKQIPGCGFTEWCLTNDENIVLCSPRKILLQNKYDQHNEDVFLVVNKYDDQISLDKDLSKKPTPIQEESLDNFETSEDRKEFFIKLKEDIRDYIISRKISRQPYKVLVTYDSFKIIKGVLSELGESGNYRVIVDEFQSIFVDSKFKSDTEIKFLESIPDIQRICYVSATPMLDKYLEMIDEFKDLPYYKFDWEKLDCNRVRKPDLKIRVSRSVYESASSIISRYKEGKFESKYVKYGDQVDQVYSREAVIYVNSVNNIITIIKKAKLTPEECNILCANTSDNLSKLQKKLGRKFSIGSIPLKGQKHKMFTFCTRTVYLGADFYSTNARTFVISDANVDTLAVDISLDLPQILGRQRLDENPWKNSATFYYRTTVSKKVVSQEEYQAITEKKMKATMDVIGIYYNIQEDQKDTYINRCEKFTKVFNYKDDYVSVKSEIIDGKEVKVPVINNLVRISELRAFEIQQIDYADRFSVFNTVDNSVSLGDSNSRIKLFLEEYQKLERLYDKLIFLCNLDFEGLLSDGILYQITESHFQEYFSVLGSARIRALGYNIDKLNKELGVVSFDKTKLRDEVFKMFTVGNRYTTSFVKSSLVDLYNTLGYNKKAVATDIEEWFDIKTVQINIKLENGGYRRDRAFEILSRKS